MSEASVKSSTKKAFTAPILKKSNDRHESKVNPKNNKQAVAVKSEANNNNDVCNKIIKKKGINSEPYQDTIDKTKKNILKAQGINSEPYQDTINKTEKNLFKAQKKESKSHRDVERSGSEKKSTKLQVSLTDSQYEDIFSAVLKGQRSNPTSSQHNTPQEHFPEDYENHSETNVMKKERKVKDLKRQHSEDTPRTPAKQATVTGTKTPPAKVVASPWGSHFSKPSSQASSILKEYQESQSSLVVSSALLSPETTGSSEEEEGALSQRSIRQLSQVSGYGSQGSRRDASSSAPAKRKKRQTKASTSGTTDQRKRLEELQSLRNVGVWVFCCRMSCQKQRYLNDVTDPQDVPDIWYCHMNPDPKYNSCVKEEERLSIEEEEDMIYNEFTAGSIVWARVTGYPWWPAMVDDDPDLEQYYWLADDLVNVTFYHVVFFDEVAVSRAWVDLKNISSYVKTPNRLKQTTIRGIDYHRRVLVAKEQANDALSLNTRERLKIYSFIARYKGPINTSTTNAKKTMTKYKLKSKVGIKESNKQRTLKTESEGKAAPTEGAQTCCRDNTRGKNDENSTKKRKKFDNPTVKKFKNHNKENNNKSEPSNEVSLVIEGEDHVAIVNKADLGISLVTPGDKNNKHAVVTDDVQNNSKVKNSLNTLNKKNTKQEEIMHSNKKINMKKGHSKKPTNLPRGLEDTSNTANENIKSDEKEKNKLSDLVEETLETSNNESETQVENMSPNSRSSSSFKKNVRDPRHTVKYASYSTLQKPLQSDSETPSLIGDNLSQKSRSSGKHNKGSAKTLQCTEETIGSVIESSQVEDQTDDLENKHSQSTIADFFAAGTEDAVVPETDLLLSQNSLPFEE